MYSKVINLFGQPGAGKSSTAYLLTGKLKSLGINAELASEFAKDLIWSNRLDCMKCQLYMLGEQVYRIERLLGQVEWIICDSPILLSAIYAPIDYPQHFIPFLLDYNNRFNNINFFIRRVKPYNPKGRTQTELEASKIAEKVHSLLIGARIPFIEVDGDDRGFEIIMEKLL